MCLLILICFQWLGFQSTEWFTNSNLISADLWSHIASLFLPSMYLSIIFHSPFQKDHKLQHRDILSLSSDYILRGFIKQRIWAKFLYNAEEKSEP